MIAEIANVPSQISRYRWLLGNVIAMTVTTPIWVPLVVAIIGLLATIIGTIAGVVMTQRRSDRREQLAWERERGRQREIWTREDAARTFELRRDAYLAFYEAADSAMRVVVQRYRTLAATGVKRGGGAPPPDDIVLALVRSMEKVSIYGSERVVGVARDIFGALSLFGFVLAEDKATVPDDLDKFDRDLQKRVNSLLGDIRFDLGIPVGASEDAKTNHKLAGNGL